ncbi:MAG TPA: PP2C family protein-serine/threonine phosphatase [Mycobacteriales bacterium]
MSSTEDDLAAIGSPDTEGSDEPIDALLREAHIVGPHQVAGLLRRHAAAVGLTDAVAYLSDLQQTVLIPLVEPAGPGLDRQLTPLGVDSTVAGRCYQNVEMIVQQPTIEGVRVWMPLLDGAERLGVLGVTAAAVADLERDGGRLTTQLHRFAAVAADVIMSRTLYGDTLVRIRRRRELGLAAELQWGLLPPLTFACPEVTVAGALEPAYEVAGDSLDYAVDAGSARFAIFDGMGHGLHSAQLTALAVAAYRNARRADMSLTETIAAVDLAVSTAHPGSFVTAVIAQLDTDTGLLSWVNVGHPEPMLLRGRRAVKSLRNTPTLPFGISRTLGREVVVHVRTEQLEPGDRLLLYTDGVTDIRSPGGEFFDVHRLLDLLAAHLAAGLPTPETMRRLVRALLEHQQGPLSDDATMLLIEWRSGNERALLPS